jgi:hypothetical protein
MKKLFYLSIVFAFIANMSFSQTFIGGSLSYSSSSSSQKIGTTTTDGNTYSNFELSPSVGYYLSDDFALGAELMLSVDVTTNPNGTNGEDKNTTTIYGIGPFMRYHFYEVDKFRFFGQAQIGFGFGTDKYKAGGSTTSVESDIFALRIKAFPGIAYELTESIDLELTFGNLEYYNISNKLNDNEDKSSSFKLNLSTGLSLGFICKF